MTTLTDSILTLLWQHGLVAVPLALGVSLATSLLPCKPGTRHGLWLMLLVWLLVGPWLPPSPSRGDGGSKVVSPRSRVEEPTAPIEDQRSKIEDHPTLEAVHAAESCGEPESEPAAPTDGDRYEYGVQAEPSRAGPPDVADVTHDAAPPTISAETPAADIQPDPIEDSGPSTPPAALGYAPILNALEPADAADEPDKAAAVTGYGADPFAPAPDTIAAADGRIVDPSWFARARRALFDGAQAWWGAIERYTAAIMRLPAPPLAWWVAGFGLVLAARLSATFWLWKRIRGGAPATPEVAALVRRVAREMHLRRVPVTRLVDARLSPMVWVGWGRVLVIPTALWNGLDRDGRMAVIAHELAHLRRRDHWACWIELAATAVYWWHPLAWWVCRRVHDEAECCCDSWVTWVLPRARRAYAEALLATRQFVDADPRIGRAAAAGMLTRPARQLARRITMIMTRQEHPRMSWSGSALVTSLAVLGWLAAPAQSNPPPAGPPSGEQPPAPAVAPVAPVEIAIAGMAAPAPIAPAVMVLAGSGDHHPTPDAGDLDARLRRLEEAVERLAQRLEGPQPKAVPSPRAQWPRVPSPPTAPRVPTPPAQSYGWTLGPRNEVLEKTYQLPDGRLQALIELMCLEQVPIVVRATQGGITVRATAAQHKIFEHFCGLIGDEEVRTYAVPEPQLGKLLELMKRQDVPVMVGSTDGGIVVHATPTEQAIVSEFINLLTGHVHDEHRGASSLRWQLPQALDRARMAEFEAHAQAAKVAAEQTREAARKAFESRRHDIFQERESMRQHREQLREERRRIEEKVKGLEGQGAGLEKAMEKLQQLMEQAGDGDHPQLAEQMAALEHALESLEQAMSALEIQADGMDVEFERLGSEMERFADLAAAEEECDEDAQAR